MFTSKSLDPLPMKQWLIKVILVSFAVGITLSLVQLAAVTNWFAFLGSSVFILLFLVTNLILALVLISVPLIPVSLILLAFKEQRETAIRCLVFGIVFSTFVIGGSLLSWKIRHNAFEALATRSQFLVDAMKEYETRFGHHPSSIKSLVSQILPEIPQTGMAAYPEYHLEITPSKEQGENRSDWEIYINCSKSLLNFDEFIYRPKQDYEEYKGMGEIERMGDWAYIHE